MSKDIDYFRQEYKRQKFLESRVESRVLVRPNVRIWMIVLIYLLFHVLIASVILLLCFWDTPIIVKVIIGILAFFSIFEGYLRFALIMTVKCYQHYAKEETRRRCKCIPSCSEYAFLSLKQIFPLLYALLKIRKRLYKTCKGEECLVDFPRKKDTEEYGK